MNAMNALRSHFDEVLRAFEQSPAIRAMQEGTFREEHYRAVLREIYFYTRENPQIQTLAAVYFRGSDRDLVKRFLRHAISEVGHDQLALNDLAALGQDIRDIRSQLPLPSTVSLVAFPFYQIQHLNHVGYLGYLFFLEFTPTQAAAKYMAYLSNIGVPTEAQTFLFEHTKVDMQHNKWMEEYADTLIRTDSDLESVTYAMQVTATLYATMLDGAMRQAESPASPGAPAAGNREALVRVRRSQNLHKMRGYAG
jgi:pyrroloquinoline quinone (PQQ) biosynthesis protein C